MRVVYERILAKSSSLDDEPANRALADDFYLGRGGISLFFIAKQTLSTNPRESGLNGWEQLLERLCFWQVAVNRLRRDVTLAN